MLNSLLKKYPTITNDTIISILPDNDISISQISKNTHLKLMPDAWIVLRMCNGLKSTSQIYEQLKEKYSIEKQELINFLIDAEKKSNIVFQRKSKYHKINIKGDGRTFFPSVATILLTNKCNLKCEYCYGNYSSLNNEFLPVTKVPLLFDILERNGVIGIELSGGEPLLHPNFNHILRLACKKKWHINILSNGVLFNEDIYKTISENRERIYLQISIDGSTESINEKVRKVKNSFNRTLNAIKHLIKMNVKVKVVLVLTPRNRKDLTNSCELMKNIGVTNFSISLADSIGRGAFIKNSDGTFFNNIYNEDFKALTKEIEKIKKDYREIIFGVENLKRDFIGDIENLGNCGAGWRIVTILPNGDVKGCQLLPVEIVKLGNIFNDDFVSMFNGREINHFYQSFWKTEKEKLCEGCEYINYCAKCSTKVFLANKNRLNEGKDYCPFAKKMNMREIMNFHHNFEYNIYRKN